MKKPQKRALKRTNKTILVAVEGYTEEAFIRYIKRSYCARDLPISVTIKNAHGQGPEGILECIKSALKTASYDSIAAVLDGDIAICARCTKYFGQQGVELFISTPAIEATLLRLKGRTPPASTDVCKRRLEALLAGDPTEERFYERHFPRELLEEMREQNEIIHRIITLITTPK